MKKRVTMQDIADELGITKVSVSKAINGQPGIGEELRRRIRDTAVRLGYEFPKNARSLTFCAIVTKRFFLETDRFYTVMYYYLNRLCMSLGHTLVLVVLSEAEERDGAPIERFCREPLDGVFLLGQIRDGFVLASGIRAPIVAMDFYSDALDVDCVLADNYQLGYQAALHLIQAGHRRIGFVGDVFATSSIADRFFGCVKALAKHDLPIRTDWALRNNDANTGEYTADIDLPADLPTAFVCHCDRAAFFLMRTLERRGLRVPDDVSLVSFDNTELGREMPTRLTTFNIGRQEIAEAAMERMLQRAEGERGPARKVYVHSELVMGETVRGGSGA